MALSKTLTLQNGLSVPNAYLRIISLQVSSAVEINNQKKRMALIQLGIFTNADSGFIEMITSDFDVNLDGKNFIAQAYDHLKTLSEFADATDV